MIVIRVMNRFAPKIADGTKPHIIRESRKRAIKVGDLLSFRQWVGAPGRAKYIILREAVCTALMPVEIGMDADIWLGGRRLAPAEETRFAIEGGFSGSEALAEYYTRYGRTFYGEVIYWDPFAPLPEKVPTFKEWIAATRAHGGNLREYRALYPSGDIRQ